MLGSIPKLIVTSLISAFIVMIFIFFIKKFTVGKNIPMVSTIAEGV